MEAVTHASRDDSQTTHSIILTDSKSLLQKVECEAKAGMCQYLTLTFRNSSGRTALNMPEWREMTKQTDWWAMQPSQVVFILEDLKCWSIWNTTKDITLLVTWRREMWKWPSLKGWEQAIFNHQRQHWGNFPSTLKLNRTENSAGYAITYWIMKQTQKLFAAKLLLRICLTFFICTSKKISSFCHCHIFYIPTFKTKYHGQQTF